MVAVSLHLYTLDFPQQVCLYRIFHTYMPSSPQLISVQWCALSANCKVQEATHSHTDVHYKLQNKVKHTTNSPSSSVSLVPWGRVDKNVACHFIYRLGGLWQAAVRESPVCSWPLSPKLSTHLLGAKQAALPQLILPVDETRAGRSLWSACRQEGVSYAKVITADMKLRHAAAATWTADSNVVKLILSTMCCLIHSNITTGWETWTVAGVML